MNKDLVTEALQGGGTYQDPKRGFIVNNKSVATFTKSGTQYQIMRDGSWRRLTPKGKNKKL